MSYAEERFELLSRLRKLATGRAVGDPFLLDQRALRFHLGTSMADLRVPVCIDPQLAEAFEVAALDLLFLLCVRHRPALREGDWDHLLLLDGFEPRNARPVSFSAPTQVKSENVRRAFVEAPELHPALDSGVLAGWITQGRPGRALLSGLNALFRRARAESAAGGDKEPTAYLVLLALRGLTEPTFAALRRVPLNVPLGRAFAGGVAVGLSLAIRLAAREAFGVDSPHGALCEAALSPLAWLGGGRHVAGSYATAWGTAFAEPPPRVDIFATRLAAGTTPDAVARESLNDLISSRELGRKAERAGALTVLRTEVLALVRLIDRGSAPSVVVEGMTLAQLYSQPGALERVLSLPDRRKELAARAKEAAKGATTPDARARAAAVATAANQWRDEEPASSWLGVPAAHKAWAQSVSALSLDLALEQMLAQAGAVLLPRDGSESEGGLEHEYERGKLYLLAWDERPILKSRPAVPLMAHLFCDVKDFTRRTASLKETVVADFLSREFYTPILTAAARHHHGATHLGDKGGIYLNNLLGDAVSFSGDVVSLVQLCDDIRRALADYGKRLESEGAREAVARSMVAIEERFARRRLELEASLLRARAAQKKGMLDPESGEEPGTRVRALLRELARLEEERDSELALARGEKLEAGIFISYGAAPEVATFEDAVFGAIKVSIAEKINESARGTGRNGSVRARVDALVAQAQLERAKGGGATRKEPPRRPDDAAQPCCPFQVHISQPLSIPVAPDVELAVRACLEHGDAEGAETLMNEAVRALLARLAGEGGAPRGGDIYNGGAALSEEALRAYISARDADFLFLKREVPVAGLHPALRERFVFPSQSLQLIAAVSGTSQALQELYVFSGRALFKGFEKTNGLGVYELIPPNSAFFALVAQHHLPAWLREHQLSGRQELDEWREAPLGASALKTGSQA